MINKLGLRYKQWRHSIRNLAFSRRERTQKHVDDFHSLYYASAAQGKTWNDTNWMGTRVNKCPLDLWNYQEILYRLKPDLIIETGTFLGGSASFFASLCDLWDKGQVVTIDIADVPKTIPGNSLPLEKVRPSHPRIQYWRGSSTSTEIIKRLEPWVAKSPVVFVVLDSDHTQEHVLKELNIYSYFVTPGSYLIVEDSNVNGHPVIPEYGPGPWEALNDFVQTNHDFEIDEGMNYKHLLTFNPRGYLKRIR